MATPEKRVRPIEHLLIVAGPTACGKTRVIREILSGGLPELGRRLGIEGWQWTLMSTQAIAAFGGELDRVILQYDFLWSYSGLNLDMADGLAILSSILEDAREVSVVTLWTPPPRLERQFIQAKLRPPARPGAAQKPALERARFRVKTGLFRLLPRRFILWMARSPWLERIDAGLPGHILPRQLRVLGIYQRPARVADLYRRWFQFCDRQAFRRQWIVELDGDLKFHSRAEWENRFYPESPSRDANPSGPAVKTLLPMF